MNTTVDVTCADLLLMYDEFGGDLVRELRTEIEDIRKRTGAILGVELGCTYLTVSKEVVRSLCAYADNFRTMDQKKQALIDNICNEWEDLLKDEISIGPDMSEEQ